MSAILWRMGVEEAELIARVEKTQAYFKARGEDPSIYAPGFFIYHCNRCGSPEEVFKIATRTEYAC